MKCSILVFFLDRNGSKHIAKASPNEPGIIREKHLFSLFA